MKSPFSIKKSRGVPVARATYAILKAANEARDAGDWATAGVRYAEALDREPQLAHIWVQLGHSELRQGQGDRAEAAYLKAASLDKEDPDPLIHLGHLRKDRGDLFGAARYYLDATRRDIGSLEGAGELQRLIACVLPTNRPDLRTLLGVELAGFREETKRPGIWLDFSNVISAVVEARALSSDLRRDAESQLILSDQPDVGICAHIEGHHGWFRLSHEQVKTLLAPVIKGGPAQLDQQKRATLLQLDLIFAPPLSFRPGDKLFCVATARNDPNHPLFAASAQEQGAVLIASANSEISADIVITASTELETLAEIRTLCGVVPLAAEVPHLALNTFIGLGSEQNGLALRKGTAWSRPHRWGSWTHPAGAELKFMVAGATEPLRVMVLLRGLPTRASGFQLFVDDGSIIEGKLGPDERKWLSINVNSSVSRPICLMIKGRDAEAVREEPASSLISVAVGLIGLFVCRESDRDTRRSFLESITFSSFDWT